MARSLYRKRVFRPSLIPMVAIGACWFLMTASALVMLDGFGRRFFLGEALAVLAVAMASWRWADSERWVKPLRRLSHQLTELAENPRQPLELTYVPELAEVIRALRDLKQALQPVPAPTPPPSYHIGMNSVEIAVGELKESMTRSGMLAAIPDAGDGSASHAPGDVGTTDMISRLEPKSFRWVSSSPAVLDFFGWSLAELREKSFLEIVHPDDYPRAKEQLKDALARGEVHGLVLRVRTASGKMKAVEMNIGARYGPDLAVTHLRCHLTDVTAKLRAERELKLRTRELEQVNEQLRLINRELQELKDRYHDLYQNAPAMYYSLDDRGRFVECNQTLLRTLGYRREELIGRSIDRMLVETYRALLAPRLAELKQSGTFEGESQWIKASGETIDVWIASIAVRDGEGQFARSRSVAQDVTARHQLEAELKEKNDRLARTNEELSRKNKEMDEFAYVVSHDLQEPLRTLIAFSDFLLSDCGDRLDAQGREYVTYLVDASRRMRSLIHGLLDLSRAGRVTGDFVEVNLDDVVRVVVADLGELIRTKGAEVRIAGPLPALWADRDRIGQLMANLIGNGLKYNKEETPRVEVGTIGHDAGPWVTIYVRDNGIGIDPQFHAKIFQLFRRLHTREEFDGTGAGLAICTKIVQAHGGRLWVESESGRGATFFVSLRRAVPEARALQTELSHAS